MAISFARSHTDCGLSSGFLDRISLPKREFRHKSSLPRWVLQNKNVRRDCKDCILLFVGPYVSQMNFQQIKPRRTTRTVLCGAQSSPKGTEKLQSVRLGDLVKPFLPLAASFIICSLGLGARVAAAAVLPASGRSLDRRLIPVFANVSSIASPSSSTEKNAVQASESRAGSSGKWVAEKPAETTNAEPGNKERVQVKEESSGLTSNFDLGVGRADECNETRIEENIRQETDPSQAPQGSQIGGTPGQLEFLEDKELKKVYEQWRSKPYALTVPLRIVALRGSVPPAWLKDFIQAQGKRLKFRVEFQGSLRSILSELAMALDKGRLASRSVMAADLVTVGDSWLELAICGGMIEPIENAEQQDWFNCLSGRWKAYLRRDRNGQIDPNGEVWAAPYRWGSMVVAYKKDKFAKHNIPPIEDWEDLWRPELKGKISMVDAPREVVGAILKSMGASYNSKSFEYDVPGGRNAVRQHFLMLQRQVRLFDSVHYLKALGSGDVWVAVGWTSDVLPVAKRMSNVAVIVPKSGTSLWADLWTIPATSSIPSDKVGGRVRGPSPLIHQWFEFCLQPARATPFQQDVFPGASPLFLSYDTFNITGEDGSSQNKSVVSVQRALVKKNGPQFDTNVVAGMPPSEILSKCEFLEPLSDEALSDYDWLMTQTVEEGLGWPSNLWQFLKGIGESFKIAPLRGVR